MKFRNPWFMVAMTLLTIVVVGFCLADENNGYTAAEMERDFVFCDSFQEVVEAKDLDVGKPFLAGATIDDKDNAGKINRYLFTAATQGQQKIFKNLDLSTKTGLWGMAILVDDAVTVKIDPMPANGEPAIPSTELPRCNGGAMWGDAAFHVLSYRFKGGKSYKINFDYYNSCHRDTPKGIEDYDGVIAYAYPLVLDLRADLDGDGDLDVDDENREESPGGILALGSVASPLQVKATGFQGKQLRLQWQHPELVRVEAKKEDGTVVSHDPNTDTGYLLLTPDSNDKTYDLTVTALGLSAMAADIGFTLETVEDASINDKINFTVLKLDLVVNGLPEENVATNDKDEDSPGALIRENSDFTQWEKAGRIGPPVRDENSATIDPDDDRLVNATLTIPSVYAGTWTLSWGNGRLRVWRSELQDSGEVDEHDDPILVEQWIQVGNGVETPAVKGETVVLKIEGVTASENWGDAALTATFTSEIIGGKTFTVTDAVKITVVDIDLVSLNPAVDLILGNDLTLNYKIDGPTGFTFDTVRLEVYNKLDKMVFMKTGLETSVGAHTTKWEKAKWNQEPHSGAYANPNNSNYKIRIVARKNSDLMKFEKIIKTKLVVESDIQDIKSGTASRAAGLGDLDAAMKIVLEKDADNYTIAGSACTWTDIVDGRRLKADNSQLNSLADGKWKIILKDVRDEIGNFYNGNKDKWDINIY
jgi:hypothetical protein